MKYALLRVALMGERGSSGATSRVSDPDISAVIASAGAVSVIDAPVALPLGGDKPASGPSPGADGGAAGDAAAHAPTQGKTGQSARRVLVVDDNLDSADTMAELVRIWGHDVRTAHDGLTALEAARSFNPQVVLLDVGLPGMDGYELARRLRAEGLAGDLLVSITGYGQEEDRRRAEEAGFDHHLTKPVDPDTLLRLFNKA